jgi:hypothetical protein
MTGANRSSAIVPRILLLFDGIEHHQPLNRVAQSHRPCGGGCRHRQVLTFHTPTRTRGRADYNCRKVSETRTVNPPIPRAWFGLAFFFGIATTFVITRTLENWTELVPVPENVPLATRRVLLTLEMMVLGVAIQAIWWLVSVRSRTHA